MGSASSGSGGSGSRPELTETGRSAVVIIDVFRAFSTAAYAAAWGAERIVLAESLEQARSLKERYRKALTLTDGVRLPDIDLVNSPAMLAHIPLAGRTLVFKTTNGTRAAFEERDAKTLLCASLVNAGATATYLRSARGEVRFVASGGPTAVEDEACAAFLRSLVVDPSADPSPYVARAASSSARGELDRKAATGHTGIHRDDAAYCLRVDAAPQLLLAEAVEDFFVLTPRLVPRG